MFWLFSKTPLSNSNTCKCCHCGNVANTNTNSQLETRHSLRSACSLPHGSRTPATGGYGNIGTGYFHIGNIHQLQLETPTQTPKYLTRTFRTRFSNLQFHSPTPTRNSNSNTQTPNENVPHNILILSKIANLTQLISDGQYCIIFTKLEKPSTRKGEKKLCRT